MIFRLKRGDTEPSVAAALINADGSLPNLNQTTEVRFKMSDKRGLRINRLARVLDAASATVAYDWLAGDTDEPGAFNVEWEVTRGSKVQTYPNEGYAEVLIEPDLR